MVQLSSKQLVEEELQQFSGFRLRRLEVYNWGTFNQRVWTIAPEGGTSLLTGANGSGKSTLVDALLTLLVPSRKRSYNLASGSEKLQDRGERSYVLGAWGKQKDIESNRSKLQYLRSKESYSVLLAVFGNASTAQDITLAEVFWIDDSVHKLYNIATSELSIDEHFRLSGMPKEWRKQLKARGIEVFDEFVHYSRRFRQLMSLGSENALDLFNQIVSIKEIGGLNAFVREHMLEKADTLSRVEQLRANFENLTRAHDAIQLAERQLAILEPLMQDAKKYAEQQERIAETNRSAELLPTYIASRKQTMLVQAINETQEQLGQLRTRRDALQQEWSELNQHVINLNVAIRNDTVGQQIDLLKQEIRQLEQRQQERKKQSESYNRLAKQVELFAYEDENAFHVNRQLAEELQQRTERQMEELTQQRDGYVQKRGYLQELSKQLEEELASLKSRSSQIPHEDVLLRQRLLDELDLTEEEVPFVGELLRVRKSEQRWEPAIERLLRGFGRQLLVAERYYSRVSRYVDNTHLHGRLVYHRINGTRTPRYSERMDSAALYHKLEVKADTAFTDWLSAELIDSFHYLCCESLEAFQRAHRAITLHGQIKHGLARHEKDDRYPLGDRKRYILGWNNKEKQAALEEELAGLRASLQQVTHSIQQIEARQGELQNQQSTLRILLSFDRFDLIDWRSIVQQCQQQRQRLAELEASSEHLATLRHQLEEAEKHARQKQDERGQVAGEVISKEREIERYTIQMEACQRVLSDDIQVREAATMALIEKDLSELQKREKEMIIALEMIDDVGIRMQQFYQKRLQSLQSQAQQTGIDIVGKMRDFRQTSLVLEQEMDASLEALDEYHRAYEQIRHEDLPRHRRRFKELLNEKVVTDIGSFKAALEQHEGDIKARIARLNRSLGSIGYTDVTYIQLNCERAHDTEVREFRDLLRSCIPDVAQARTSEANEVSFQRIQALLQRFEQDQRWAAKVIDVRNWLDFSASELYRENGEQKNYYSDSSGKSGGQKAKLAYTILASAIAYQYGLDQEQGRERTFRFIAVDEAFSKSDERNARYAMELFQQLDLQVLVVTPLDKNHIVEPYITTCHFVFNNEEENDSKVYDLTFAEYQTQKQAWREQERLQ